VENHAKEATNKGHAERSTCCRKSTDVSEERIVSTFRAEEEAKLLASKHACNQLFTG
jgi:hypothetical protein